MSLIENAKRYYIGPTATRANAELVGVSASAAPGHVLKGLKIEGGGQVWRWEGHGNVDDYMSLDDMVPAEPNGDGLYVDEDLYVEMTASATVAPVVKVDTPEIHYFCVAQCLPQQRTTIGIGEQVVIGTIADDNLSYGEDVDWVVTIPGADTVYSFGHSVSFIAPRYSTTYPIVVKATYNCKVFYEQVFNVLIPNGEDTTYDHWESAYSQIGTDLMGGTTVYKVTILPKNVCFANVNFKEQDAITVKSWNNPAYGNWATSSGGPILPDCNNVWFDYFGEDYVDPDALLVGGQYVEFVGDHNFQNYFQTELGEWFVYTPVFTRVLFSEVLSLGPDPGDNYYGFPMLHFRDGLEGVEIGSWAD